MKIHHSAVTRVTYDEHISAQENERYQTQSVATITSKDLLSARQERYVHFLPTNQCSCQSSQVPAKRI